MKLNSRKTLGKNLHLRKNVSIKKDDSQKTSKSKTNFTFQKSELPKGLLTQKLLTLSKHSITSRDSKLSQKSVNDRLLKKKRRGNIFNTNITPE